ncbi:GNAT family N-acetyltransferase [Halomonas sp. HNIBRBA4712]|uniref:GNAT family N-acetyltransferase n=1 Tax=Halomonas sp. HNIBRBA4712 TaxID=3373087 RepID=UPI0037473A93
MPCHETFDHCCVTPCPFERRREALLQLAAVHDPAQQPALSAALAQAKATPTFDWQGLWVIMCGARIESALWIEPLAEATARLWLPASRHDGLQALLSAAWHWAQTRGVTLCHVILDAGQFGVEAALKASGMALLSTLEQLQAALSPPPPTGHMLALSPFDALSRDQQKALLQGIGEGSLDCPALREALSVETLLGGFEARAAPSARHWYRVTRRGDTIGALLLNAHDARHWELQLMGLFERCRGQGLGAELLALSKRVAFDDGASTLSLTLDAGNLPARKCYAAGGFAVQARQRLWAWKR